MEIIAETVLLEVINDMGSLCLTSDHYIKALNTIDKALGKAYLQGHRDAQMKRASEIARQAKGITNG